MDPGYGLDWHEVLESDTTQDKADAFYTILDLGMSTCFREVKRRDHSNDKLWITTHIKSLVKKRQKAFSCGQDQEWRELRNKVQREIVKTKKPIILLEYLVFKNQNQENGTLKQNKKKMVTKSTKVDLKLNVSGVDDENEKGKANAINGM